MIKITRGQVLQLFDELEFKPPHPEVIPYLRRFVQAAFTRWGYPQWHPIDTAPRDGKFFLAINIADSSSMMIVNWPAGCYPGRWCYDKKRKEWFGSGYASKYTFTHWAESPKLPCR